MTRTKVLMHGLVLAIGFLIALSFLSQFSTTLTNYWPLGVDIYPRWIGSRDLWNGSSPYEPRVQFEAETIIYGRPAQPEEVRFLFSYPAYIAVPLIPFLFLPIETAAIAWSALMLVTNFALTAAWAWTLVPRPSPWLWGIILISGVLFRPAITSIINGQFALFVVGCTLAAWWLITERHDRWAGLALALSTIKPSISLLLPLALCLWAIRWRRWDFLSGFSLSMGLLLGVTFLKVGWWIPDFIRDYAPANLNWSLAWTPAWIATVPGLVWLVATLTLMSLGMLALWRSSEFPWIAAFAALNLNLLVSPHAVEYDLAALLLELWWLGRQWQSQRWGIALWLVLVWIPWLSWAVTMVLGYEVLVWWKAVWQFYPTLLLTLLIGWIMLFTQHTSNTRVRNLIVEVGVAGSKPVFRSQEQKR